MGIETLTDEKIAQLLATPKRVENPQAREKQEGQHIKRDYRIVSDDGDNRFALFTRQSTRIADGFSAGLLWHAKTGEEVMLLRCNGANHFHPNVLERERIEFQCHVHVATERYIQANRKSEGYAQATQAYQTLAGALHHLVQLAHIEGLKTEPGEAQLPGLFEERP
ncbi:MAG: hypothetical protein LAD29_13185 [Rhodoferax sp.]|nr:hypothetical protein [Rhodoferax sp.]